MAVRKAFSLTHFVGTTPGNDVVHDVGVVDEGLSRDQVVVSVLRELHELTLVRRLLRRNRVVGHSVRLLDNTWKHEFYGGFRPLVFSSLEKSLLFGVTPVSLITGEYH